MVSHFAIIRVYNGHDHGFGYFKGEVLGTTNFFRAKECISADGCIIKGFGSNLFGSEQWRMFANF